jgi:hypothetical protein
MILGIAHNHELWERPKEIEIFKEMMVLSEEVMVVVLSPHGIGRPVGPSVKSRQTRPGTVVTRLKQTTQFGHVTVTMSLPLTTHPAHNLI